MLRVWRYDDPAMPDDIKRLAFRGGDEDYVIVGPASDEVMFEFVASAMEARWSNDWKPEHVVRFEDGEPMLLWVVCHA
jgi:hypothetical protein